MYFEAYTEGDDLLVIHKKHKNNIELLDIPLHFNFKKHFAELILFYPLTPKKEKIFLGLKNGGERLGFLNSYTLSVARKLELSQILIKRSFQRIYQLNRSNKLSKSGILKRELYEERSNLNRELNLLFELIFEETTKRRNTKYLRKKKLEKISS